MKRKGQLFVVSAPSGAGKTTLCNMLLKEFSNLSYSISYTTRAPRSKEVHGRDYFFIDALEFESMILKGGFMEYAKVHGYLYGTSKNAVLKSLELGRDILLDIDVQGAMKIKQETSLGVYIFINPPSMEVLHRRLYDRNDTPEDNIELRLKNAEIELAQFVNYDYVVENDILEAAYKQISSIYIAETCRCALLDVKDGRLQF
ncbi:MAG: guanylate kinase [Deferribacteraceae bacterium]|jgi:guanylate kinase|nr:guanylate kinase [Deferribacteraceae bacterium]